MSSNVECHIQALLLSVIMLSVAILNVVVLNFVASWCRDYRSSEFCSDDI
jgi:hypothetical protein